MPNTKISADTAASTLTGAEIVPVVQSGTNVRTTVLAIANFGRSTTISDYAGATAKEKLEAFIAYANAAGGNVSLSFEGGSHTIATQVNARIIVPNVHIYGKGARITAGTGAIFRYGDDSTYTEGGLVDGFEIYFSAPGIADVTSKVCTLTYGGRFQLKNITMFGGGWLFDGGGMTGGHTNSTVLIQNITGGVDNIAGAPFIRRGITFGLYVDQVRVYNRYNSGANTCATNRDFIIDVETGTRSTIQVSNTTAERFDFGYRAYSGTGSSNVDIFFNDIVFDSMYSKAWWGYVDGSGVMASVNLSDCWLSAVTSALATSYCCEFEGSGASATVGFVNISNPTFNGGKSGGLRVAGRVREFACDGGRSVTYESPAVGKAGVILDNTDGRLVNIAIRGMMIESQVTAVLTSFIADTGIHIIGTAPIVGLTVSGSTIGGTANVAELPAFASAEATMFIGNNRLVGSGTKYSGQQTTGIYVRPATTVAWTNTTAHRVEITVGGGTVTVIAKNGVTTGAITFFGVLEPADTLTLTYSANPTMLFFVKA